MTSRLRLREPVNGITHLVGALLSVVGLVFLLIKAVSAGTVWHIVSFAVFGTSLILLYTASSLYHLLPLGKKGVSVMRRIDHMMIYVLIAGSYTPMCLVALRGAWGWSLLGAVLGTTVAGILMKTFWMDAPRWLSTLIYVIMGWGIVIGVVPLAKAMSINGMLWLGAGGLFYSLGAVIYGLKWPKFFPKFGFHEVWHLFVMGGSLCHYWMVFRYIGVI